MTQESALTILKLGHSVFLTGGAGSGKTHVLNLYIHWLRTHKIQTAITASTGIAATHIGGTTIHSWAGIGIKESLSEYELDELEQNKNLYTRLKSTQVLIIDEISMLDSKRLDMIDVVLRTIRKDERIFGGMQVVFCGDFFQLPPVSRNKEVAVKDFAFNAKAWVKLNPVVCYLTTQHRHGDDVLSFVLNGMRANNVDEEFKSSLLTSSQKSLVDTPHTKLYTHNEDVDRINEAEYNSLSGDEKVFEMKAKGKANAVHSLVQNCLAPEILKLKIGTRVIFVKNDTSKNYSNGTLGEVMAFTTSGLPIVKTSSGKEVTVSEESWRIEEDGKVKAEIKQLPLRYAWAITVHKSQGMTLDRAQIDLSKTFTFGMGYVALSRVRRIEGLELVGFHDDALLMHPEITKVDKVFHQKSDRAAEALKKYSEKEIQKLQEKFISRSYGTIEEQIDDDKEEVSTKEITKKLLEEKFSLEEIAAKRNLTVGTIITHIESLIKEDRELNINHLVSQIPKHKSILALIKKAPSQKLTDLMKLCKEKRIDTTFENLRIIKTFCFQQK